MIKNDRLWRAVRALATAEGDVRHRVATACEILEAMHKSELTSDLRDRLDRVLEQAGKKGPLVNIGSGEVIKGKYKNTITGKHNRTYKKLAEEIFRIYEEFNNN